MIRGGSEIQGVWDLRVESVKGLGFRVQFLSDSRWDSTLGFEDLGFRHPSYFLVGTIYLQLCASYLLGYRFPCILTTRPVCWPLLEKAVHGHFRGKLGYARVSASDVQPCSRSCVTLNPEDQNPSPYSSKPKGSTPKS